MDKKKLSSQIFAIGQIYRVIVDACPQAEVSHPEMYPMRTYAMAILKLNQNRKSSSQIERTIAMLSDKIVIDDWDGIFNMCLPLELQGEFLRGYTMGVSKTKLASARKKLKMTQVELADMIGVSQKDISRWERGDVKPNSSNLKNLAKALKCSIDDIV